MVQVMYPAEVQGGVKLHNSVAALHEVVCDVDWRTCVDVVVIWLVLREACDVVAKAWEVALVICVVLRKFCVDVNKFCVVLRSVCVLLCVI